MEHIATMADGAGLDKLATDITAAVLQESGRASMSSEPSLFQTRLTTWKVAAGKVSNTYGDSISVMLRDGIAVNIRARKRYYEFELEDDRIGMCVPPSKCSSRIFTALATSGGALQSYDDCRRIAGMLQGVTPRAPSVRSVIILAMLMSKKLSIPLEVADVAHNVQIKGWSYNFLWSTLTFVATGKSFYEIKSAGLLKPISEWAPDTVTRNEGHKNTEIRERAKKVLDGERYLAEIDDDGSLSAALRHVDQILCDEDYWLEFDPTTYDGALQFAQIQDDAYLLPRVYWPGLY